jgi:hypothetical protein
MATAHDAAKAVIAYLKSLDDARDISVEQVEPDENNNDWTVHVTLWRTPSTYEPRSWKRFHLVENPDGKLEVRAMFDSLPLSQE